MRLHIGIVGVKERLGVIGRQDLDLVDELTAGIEPMARCALCVFVAKPVAHGQQHRGRCIILRSDQLELAPLVPEFASDVLGNRRLGGTDNVECGTVCIGFSGVDRADAIGSGGVLHSHARSVVLPRTSWRRVHRPSHDS